MKLTENVGKNEKVVTSGKWQMPILQDFQAWGMNALKYSSPVILLILVSIQAGQSWDEIKLAVYALVLQNAINVFSKLAGTNKYVVEK